MKGGVWIAIEQPDLIAPYSNKKDNFYSGNPKYLLRYPLINIDSKILSMSW